MRPETVFKLCNCMRRGMRPEIVSTKIGFLRCPMRWGYALREKDKGKDQHTETKTKTKTRTKTKTTMQLYGKLQIF